MVPGKCSKLQAIFSWKIKNIICPAKRDFKVWTYDSDNSTQVNININMSLLMFFKKI